MLAVLQLSQKTKREMKHEKYYFPISIPNKKRSVPTGKHEDFIISLESVVDQDRLPQVPVLVYLKIRTIAVRGHYTVLGLGEVNSV